MSKREHQKKTHGANPHSVGTQKQPQEYQEKKEATDPSLNDNSIANQSQFYYEKSLAIIENEISIINSRSSFLAQIEGLLLAGYGVCFGIYVEQETTAALFLIILIPVIGATIAAMTFSLVRSAENVICSVETEWELYKKDNEQNPLFKALSFPALSILQPSSDKKEGQNKCTLVLRTSLIFLLMWFCFELLCIGAYKNHLIATVSLYFPFCNKEQYNTMYWRTKKDLSSFSELKITKIEDDSFSGCSTLSSIIIPPTVTKIGNHAFSGCVDLNSLVIPASVDEIGKHAFSGCTGITSIVIPSSVKKIDDYTFSGCTSLSAVLTPTRYRKSGIMRSADVQD